MDRGAESDPGTPSDPSGTALRDDRGTPFGGPAPRRVVSLVPSRSEAIAATDVGLLVGATDRCTHARAAWADPPSVGPARAVVPIWRRPWMVLGRDTFAGDVLAHLGVVNVFATSADRYPRLTPGRVAQVDAPELLARELRDRLAG